MMNSRKLFFYLKNKSIGENVNQIREINLEFSESEIRDYHNVQFRNLVNRVNENVPYYKTLKAEHLIDFPIVDKSFIKTNLNQLISVKAPKGKVHEMITSGSTGTPFKSFQDSSKRERNSADTIFFAKEAGYEIGKKLHYLKIWSSLNRKNIFLKKLQNIVAIDVLDLSEKKIKHFLEDFKNDGNHITGYSSALERICRYIDNDKNRNSTYKADSIISMSEALEPDTKRRLKEYFSCMPCSRYSNIEQGIIAQQTLSENDKFLVNNASYIIELLKLDSDEKASPGQLGRIVITDLYNSYMPFIRYDTGDLGIVNYTELDVVRFIDEIQGRKLDVLLNTKGEIISSYIVYKNMFKYTEIDQYQLIQEGKKNYKFIISCTETFNREKELVNEFVMFLGSDADFICEYVSEIPLLSSGKRRKVVNNYLKQ